MPSLDSLKVDQEPLQFTLPKLDAEESEAAIKTLNNNNLRLLLLAVVKNQNSPNPVSLGTLQGQFSIEGEYPIANAPYGLLLDPASTPAQTLCSAGYQLKKMPHPTDPEDCFLYLSTIEASPDGPSVAIERKRVAHQLIGTTGSMGIQAGGPKPAIPAWLQQPRQADPKRIPSNYEVQHRNNDEGDQ